MHCFVVVAVCFVLCFFPIRIQINTVINTVQSQQRCDCRQGLAHGGHASTLHSSTIPIKAEILSPKKQIHLVCGSAQDE